MRTTTLERRIMKKYILVLVVALAGLLVGAGCEKRSTVDTSNMEKSFASAEPTTKSEADKAIASIKAGDYGAAVASLQQLAAKAKLTPEREQAVKDIIAQLKKQLNEKVEQAGEAAKKGLGDLQKSGSK